jgi:hypothetical protein
MPADPVLAGMLDASHAIALGFADALIPKRAAPKSEAQVRPLMPDEP